MLPILIVWSFLFVALDAGDLLIVANRLTRDSVDIARYYMKKRGVPEKNLPRISIKDVETCDREEYDRKIARPIRARLKTVQLSMRPRCIFLVKGIPLRIRPEALTAEEKAEVDRLKNEQKFLNDKILAISGEEEKEEVVSVLDEIVHKIKAFNFTHNTVGSVDSELMLVLADDYPLSMWVANPFFVGFKDKKPTLFKNDVIMVSRLDAPSGEIVRRMIDDAVAAEEKGSTGKAYIDARWPDPKETQLFGYALYDKSIHLAGVRARTAALRWSHGISEPRQRWTVRGDMFNIAQA